MLRYVLVLFVMVSFFSCREKEPKIVETESAAAIVKTAIEVAGGELFDRSEINFDFRDKHYRALRHHGIYQLERHFKDSLSEFRDVLSNSGFERFKDDEKVALTDSLVSVYSASVNSVHYFSVLPYGLDGEAVHKKDLGIKNIKGDTYHKIKITFSEEGGGEDFDDEFIYWINKEKSTVDYLAYSYKEVDGSLGLRFRDAYNERMVNGLRFADYDNYKAVTANPRLENLDDLFINDQLELLSKIELKNIKVKELN